MRTDAPGAKVRECACELMPLGCECACKLNPSCCELIPQHYQISGTHLYSIANKNEEYICRCFKLYRSVHHIYDYLCLQTENCGFIINGVVVKDEENANY